MIISIYFGKIDIKPCHGSRSFFKFRPPLVPLILSKILTCHCCLSYGKEEGYRVGESETEDNVGVEERQGEHQEGGRHVDQIVNTEGDHQPE